MDRDLSKVYASMASTYAEHAADSPYNAHYDRPSVLELCGEIAGLRILDAGCGPGLYAAELVGQAARVVCFDASEPMVNLARLILGSSAEVLHLNIGEVLPFDAGSFDLVLCALAIHYANDRLLAFKEFHRVLAPGGAVVLSTQHPTTDWLRKGGSYFDVAIETDIWEREEGNWDVSFWREPLTSLCAAIFHAGFLIERVVEPLPAESMRERWPEHYEKLSQEPGFLVLRLLKRETLTK